MQPEPSKLKPNEACSPELYQDGKDCYLPVLDPGSSPVQAERHADKQHERAQRLEARLAAVEVRQASHGLVLGEVKALLVASAHC